MDLDEAISVLIGLLKASKAGNYGYDLYPRVGAQVSAEKIHPNDVQAQALAIRKLSPIFFDAAWELCRRGVVRPGVRVTGDQAVNEGGYCLSAAGRTVLESIDENTIVVLQPGSLASTFKQYQARFGHGFYQRAMESIRCRNAEAWLASCAMTGAAAESVLLAVAIAKLKDEEHVLRTYAQSGGRSSSRRGWTEKSSERWMYFV